MVEQEGDVMGKKWTKEEDAYLEEAWGTKSVAAIAKHLGRSIDSINVRRTRKGLGRYLESGDYVTYSQLLQAVFGLDSAENAYRISKRWMDFPMRKKKILKDSYRVVYLDEFWQWAEEHKRQIDFSKMEESILGAEPEWVKRKRKIDFQCRVKTTPWTSAEDAKLERMLERHKYTYTDLAAELNRSEAAVRRRIWDLAIDTRPVRAKNISWTEEEVQTLVFMYEEGYSFEMIGRELHRNALACRGKMERIEHPEYTLRAYRRGELYELDRQGT